MPRASSAIQPSRSGCSTLGRELRLKEMDEAGVDIQVLSHGAPSAQKALRRRLRPRSSRRVNDRLAAFVKTKPDRFAAFGALPTCQSGGGRQRARAPSSTRHGFQGRE